MSRIDDIEAAYRKGQEFRENSDPFQKFEYQTFHHTGQAAMSAFFTEDDEAIAFRYGYDGVELELCYECERIEENCKCDNSSNDSASHGDDESGSIRDDYSSGESSSSSLGYSSDSSSSSTTSAGGCIAPLLIVLAVIGGVYWLSGIEIKRWGKEKEVWTMMGVNTDMLNVRSGPGTNYGVVEKFPRGARLAITGQPTMNGSDEWIRVSIDDGKVQGWANLKYLSASPQMDKSPKGQERLPEAEVKQPAQEPTNGTSTAPAAEVPPNVTVIPRSAATPSPTPTPVEIITSRDGQIVPVEPTPRQTAPNTPRQEIESSDDIPRLKRRPPQDEGVPTLRKRDQ